MAALDFHHVCSKDRGLGGNNMYSMSSSLPESLKTILVCSNCHRGIHNDEAFASAAMVAFNDTRDITVVN